jgi:hypothetical protein
MIGKAERIAIGMKTKPFMTDMSALKSTDQSVNLYENIVFNMLNNCKVSVMLNLPSYCDYKVLFNHL